MSHLIGIVIVVEKMLTKRIYENLLWIREGLIAAGKDTTEIDAKIEKLREELQNNPVAKENK